MVYQIWIEHKAYFIFIGQLFLGILLWFFGAYLLLRTPPLPPRDHQEDKTFVPWSPTNREILPSASPDTVSEDLRALQEEIRWTKTHDVAWDETVYLEKINQLCSVYQDICKKINREGSYSAKEQFYYQGLTIALLTIIDKAMTTDTMLQEALSSLKIYKHPTDRRGSSGHTTVRINTESMKSYREFREVLTHEFGHTIDLSVLRGKHPKKSTAYTEFGRVMRPIDDPSISYYTISRVDETTRKAESSYLDFVSGYGMHGIYEDYAEAHNLWLNHNSLFEKMASTNPVLRKKYQFFADLYDKQRFDDNQEQQERLALDKRVRDTTKIIQ